MSSQENKELVSGESIGTSVVFDSYIRYKLEELPDKVSQAKFNDIYSSLWKKPSRSREKVFGVFKGLVKKALLEEFDELNQSFGMEEKLRTKTEICSEYSALNVTQWRPNGNIEETLNSHDMKEMLKRKMLLEESINGKLKNIEQLKQMLEKNSSKIKRSEEKIDRAIQDCELKLSCNTRYTFVETQLKRK